jgi:hypothetical protein
MGARGHPGRYEEMKRIALVVVWGGMLFAAGEAGACEAHSTPAQAAPVSPDSRREDAARDAAEGKKDGAGEAHAAKCQCGSAADCTCKKGTCECSKCKKPRRHEAPVEAEATEAVAVGV